MLPYEKEVQKATKLYLLIINIGFALILLYAFITAATFFAIGQMHMNHVNPITLTGTPIYAFIAVAVPATIAYVFLRVVIEHYKENLRQSYMMANADTKAAIETVVESIETAD